MVIQLNSTESDSGPVEVYENKTQISGWCGFSDFQGGISKLKSYDQLIEETLKKSGKNLNEDGQKLFKENIKRIHDRWNPPNKRLIKSYNAVISALNILSDTKKDDKKRIKQLSELNEGINWELCLDNTFVERLVFMAVKCIQDNNKVINNFDEAYNDAVIKSVMGESAGRRSMYSMPASNCEITGICHCGSDAPLKRGSCLMTGATLQLSPMEKTQRDENMFSSLGSAIRGSLFDDDEDDHEQCHDGDAEVTDDELDELEILVTETEKSVSGDN